MAKVKKLDKSLKPSFSLPRPRLASWQLVLWLGGLGLIWMCSAGCVQRRLTIRTDPPGAMAYVDGYPIGTTPISTDFIYYGAREIRLVKDGYETLVVKQRIWPPWYEIPPLDFVSENLVPGELRDQRTLDFRLQPQRIVPSEQLVDRAERLRRGEVFQPATGAMSTGGPGSPPGSAAGMTPWLNPPGSSPGSATSIPPRLNPPGTPGSGSAGTTPESDIGGRAVYPLPPPTPTLPP